MEKLIEGLNPEQREVVYHDKGPLLVGAVAGSGKTQALIRRVGYLVTVRGVEPTRIIAVTFSKSGAAEMQKRLETLIGDSGARIGTFHSLAFEILKHEKPEYRTWRVDDTGRYRVCIKEAVGHKGMKWANADISILEHFIELCKADCARPGSDGALEIAVNIRNKKLSPATDPFLMDMAYNGAEEIRKSRQLICFDDMLMEGVELLRKPLICQRWANKYDYVLQDECQDQSMCQLEIGELLSRGHRNYMMVGDPSQTIFSWRGSRVENFFDFKERWGARLIVMNRNYRCGKTIIDTANQLLAKMAPGTCLETEMIGERDIQGEVSITSYANLDEEGNGIAQQIKILLVDRVKPRDVAVLYRTNAQSRAPEEALISAGIPYQVIGGVNFYARKEVKHLLSYLRVASGRGSYDDVAGSINSPFRYLGAKFLERIQQVIGSRTISRSWTDVVRKAYEQEGLQGRQRQSATEWIDIIERMTSRIHGSDIEEDVVTQESRPSSILEDIVRETGYKEWLRKDEGEETPDNNRVSNVVEMIRAASRFSSVDALLDYVDTTLAASKKQNKRGGISNKVILCSLHRVKGLEYNNVFIVGVCEKILPHGRSEDIEEERRLFYVGVTRARDRLAISSVRQIAVGGDLRDVEPSRFLREIQQQRLRFREIDNEQTL